MENYFNKSEIINLSQSVQYNSGAIVSKIISKNTAGNISLFAFDKGQSLSEHTAPFDAFVYIVDGKAEIRIDGKPFVCNPGEMIIMPANVPHSVHATEQFKMLLIMLKA